MYFKRFMETLTECEIVIHEAQLKCMSIHPYELISDKENVLQEAFDLKQTAETAINKAIKVFSNMIETFRKVSLQLGEKNSKWVESASRFDINKVDLKDFDHKMFDYKKGVQNIEHTTIPDFRNINVEYFTGDCLNFKQEHFKDLYTDDNGNSVINKNYFRGSDEKIAITPAEVHTLYQFALSWIKRYRQVTDAIVRDSKALNATLESVKSNNQVPVTESTILIESLFRDEYYDILLEDALDPKDIEKDMKENEQNKNDIKLDNKEVVETKEKNTTKDAVEKYWKICSTIQTMKIDACKEAYAAFTDFIDKVMKCPTRK